MFGTSLYDAISSIDHINALWINSAFQKLKSVRLDMEIFFPKTGLFFTIFEISVNIGNFTSIHSGNTFDKVTGWFCTDFKIGLLHF